MEKINILNQEDILNRRELNKILKSIFSGQITINFMLDIFYIIYDFNKDIRALIIKNPQLVVVICELIVGAHKSKTIFFNDEERAKTEDNKEYRNELVEDVLKMFKLRDHINLIIRPNQLIKGDKFLLFPVPYYIAILESNFVKIAEKSKEIPYVYSTIAYKSLAILSLLQDNFGDCAYSICRVIIEEYLRGNIFKNCKEALYEYDKFTQYELKKSIRYPQDEEFDKKFKNRLNKTRVQKSDFLHYGWVDAIPGYHSIIKERPYTFTGIKNFIVEKFSKDESKGSFEILEYYHNMCHGYVHGSIQGSKYPLLHYFEINSILVNVTVNAYSALCNELKIDSSIDGIDVLSEINKHYKILEDAEKKKSTESFEDYYKRFKLL